MRKILFCEFFGVDTVTALTSSGVESTCDVTLSEVNPVQPRGSVLPPQAPSGGATKIHHYQFYESLNLFFWRVRRPSRVQLRMQKWYARPMVHSIARESIAFL